jgi:uncharacterized membrane protein YhiD involved in acid resistance
MAVIATAIVLFTLWILTHVEDWIDVRSHRDVLLLITVRDTEHATSSLLAKVAGQGMRIDGLQFESGREKHTRVIRLRFCPPADFDRNAFVVALSSAEGVIGVEPA